MVSLADSKRFKIKQGVNLIQDNNRNILSHNFLRTEIKGKFHTPWLMTVFSVLQSYHDHLELEALFPSEQIPAVVKFIEFLDSLGMIESEIKLGHWEQYLIHKSVRKTTKLMQRIQNISIGLIYIGDIPQELSSEILKIFPDAQMIPEDQVDLIQGLAELDFIICAAPLQHIQKILPIQKKCIQPFLPVVFSPFGGSVGPLFQSNSLFCFNCFLSRFFMSKNDVKTYTEHLNIFSEASSSSHFFKKMLSMSCINELSRYICTVDQLLPHGAYFFNYYTMKNTYEYLLPVPNCECD